MMTLSWSTYFEDYYIKHFFSYEFKGVFSTISIIMATVYSRCNGSSGSVEASKSLDPVDHMETLDILEPLDLLDSSDPIEPPKSHAIARSQRTTGSLGTK